MASASIYANKKRGRRPLSKTAFPKATAVPGSTPSLKEHHAAGSTTHIDSSYAKKQRATNVTPVVYFSRWIADLFPKVEIHSCISAAIIRGIKTNPTDIAMPQMKIHKRCDHAYAYHHRFEGQVYDDIWTFGNGIAMQDFIVILRTALYAGLRLPGWSLGTCHDTTRAALTIHEVVALLTTAGVRPARPDLFPSEVYDDLRLDPENAGVFKAL